MTMTTKLELDPSQEAAVELMIRARIAIVTGGPGTGKTTTLRTALDRIDQTAEVGCLACEGTGLQRRTEDNEDHERSGFRQKYHDCLDCYGTGRRPRCLLAAPTGKAAKRMQEATGRTASTIHRLLEYSPGSRMFERNAARPLECDRVFIDESSMLDIELASHLFAAIDRKRTRMTLIGDADQLPSVGPGRVFADLISSATVPIARLTHLHRAAAESWVCSQAPRVLAGEMPDLSARKDFRWVQCEDRDEAVKRLVWEAQQAMGLVPRSDIQILNPRNTGPVGTEQMNVQLQNALNPDGAPAWIINGVTLRVGDPVIQTKNNYTIGVMNGETGTVIGSNRDYMIVDFGERRSSGEARLIEYDRNMAASLRLAYALSIHKSQGSEWPWVVLFAHSTHALMLTRQLFYTAITRASRGVVIVGDKRGIALAVKQTRDADRRTALKARLTKAMERSELAEGAGLAQ
jgi:exodeoxyribonuclease V alpha subunit